MSRNPLTANTGVTNRANSSLFSRGVTSGNKPKTTNTPGRLTVSQAPANPKPKTAPRQDENVEAKPEVSAVHSQAEIGNAVAKEPVQDALSQ